MERPCVQCREPVAFDKEPGDGHCDRCGTDQYVTAKGQVGRYPGEHSFKRYI